MEELIDFILKVFLSVILNNFVGSSIRKMFFNFSLVVNFVDDHHSISFVSFCDENQVVLFQTFDGFLFFKRDIIASLRELIADVICCLILDFS